MIDNPQKVFSAKYIWQFVNVFTHESFRICVYMCVCVCVVGDGSIWTEELARGENKTVHYTVGCQNKGNDAHTVPCV